MKYILSLIFLVSVQNAQASWFRDDLSGPEAFALFHKQVVQLKVDMQQWLAQGQVEIPKIKRSSKAGQSCLQSNNPKACEAAVHELLVYSVVYVREPSIFQLDRDLKTKYRFDLPTGLRIFQLSTALRWMARDDVYNGVPSPKVYNSRTYKSFLANVEVFQKNKNIDLKRAIPMITPDSAKR